MRMIVKCRNNLRTRSLFARILTEFSGKNAKKVTLSIDLNPASV